MSAAPILVTSDIVRATLFSDSAHVVRRVHTSLEGGLSRVAIKDLPRHLDPTQLRVATSRGQVRFVDSDDLAWQRDEADPDDAEARVHEAEQAVWRLRGQLAALQQELQLINEVVPGRGLKGPSGPLKPEAFFTGLEALSKRRRQTLYATRVTQYELHLAEHALNDALEFATSVGRTEISGPSTLLVVGLHLEEGGPTQLDLTYTSGWATWRPYYTLRLAAGARSVQMARFADIWQQTQEDWPAISLAVSTAEPEDRLQLPSVAPWILSTRNSFDANARGLYSERRRSAPPKGAVPMPSRSVPPPSRAAMAKKSKSSLRDEVPEEVLAVEPQMDELEVDHMADYAQQFEEEGIFAEITSAPMTAVQAPGEPPSWSEDRPIAPSAGHAPPAPPIPPTRGGTARRPPSDHPDLPRLLEHAVPRAASGGIDFQLEVPGATTCPSGRGHQRIGLGQASYEAEVQYLLRPAVKDHAFAQVTVTHSEPVPLLAGPAAIFVDDAFFGTTRILTTPAGGKLVLDLGAETGLKSARRSKTTVRTEGIINKEDVHAVHITIEIESYLDRPARIEVQDQIPVSADSRVRVKLLETRPRAQLDEKTGILTFEQTLAPKGQAELRISYEIEAPRDYKIVQSLGDAS